MFSVNFFVCSNGSRSNGPRSTKLSCKNTLCCCFCPAEWEIFKVGGDPVPYPLLFRP